ncbi:hypothetical protein FXO37_08376 [Capsicum annuum]|nr:hypothetical protein FXO37_08376 [Capsicum annuum]
MSRVWYPRQPWCANSPVLQSYSTLAAALSPNFTRFDIVERGLFFYPKKLVSGSTWRRKVPVYLLAWHAETCLLKVTTFASLGMVLLWKVDSGLAPLAKCLLSILACFHRCTSEGLDTKIIFNPFQLFMTNFISGTLAGTMITSVLLELPNFISLDRLCLFQHN